MLTKNTSRLTTILRRISRHIIPILLLVLIEMSPKFPTLKAANLGIYIVYYIYDIGYFYLITLGFMPLVISWFRKKRLLQELVAALAIPLYGILIIFYSAGYTFLLNGKATLFLDFETIQKGSMRGVLICALAYAVAYAREKIKSDKQVSDQKIYALQLENNILNLQTNPHLINNVLGYLAERIETYSSADASAIVLLSELTSDSLGATDEQGKISILDEIGYIRKYLKLEALYREKEPFKNIQINIDGQEHLRIAPKLLLDPVVNLLKYGDNQNEQNTSCITIGVYGTALHMETYNMKKLSKKTIGNHIGIKNLKQRLELNYPEKHLLSIEENELEYRLTLAIELC
jgi:Putative regulator of cell autolysis